MTRAAGLTRVACATHIVLVTAMVSAGCGFSLHSTETDVDGAVPDVTVEPKQRWAVSAVTRGSGSIVTVRPLEGGSFKTACAEQVAPGSQAIRSMLPHSTMPLVYAVDAGFHAISLGCAGSTWRGTLNIGGARPIQRIALDPGLGVGFFTADGAGATGVYRFTVSPTDASPVVTGSANATSQAGALALDAAGNSLFVAGANIAARHELVSTSHELPATYMTAAGCLEPVDLLLSGTSALGFCMDASEIRRYDRNPFVSQSPAGSLGAVVQVISLPNDRAVAGRLSPPDLALLELGAGSPTWTTGPTLTSPITAMAASSDGELLVTARLVDATHTELATWEIGATSITLVDRETIDGEVTALAVTQPGS